MELREFLNRVVGQGSITQNDEGQWSIKPYEVVITSRNGDHVNGFISFKGERFQEFNGDAHNDLRIVNGIVESSNMRVLLMLFGMGITNERSKPSKSRGQKSLRAWLKTLCAKRHGLSL